MKKSKVIIEGVSVLDVDETLKRMEETSIKSKAGRGKKRQRNLKDADGQMAHLDPKIQKPMYWHPGRPTKYQPEWMLDKVLELGMNGASLAKIAFTLGITFETLKQWENKFPEFSDAIKMARLGSQVWFEEILQAAMTGGLEGVPVPLLIFALKTRYPETYREVRVTELSGRDGNMLEVQAVAIDPSALDPEQRELVKQALLAAKAAAERGEVSKMDTDEGD